jgi:hypothetical protein
VITFRYHIVSLVAVFLALAVGIVVGTTALNGPVTSDLRRQVNDLKKQRTESAGQVKTLQGQIDSANQFTSTFGAKLVANSLKGDRVLVVSLPGVSTGMQDGIANQLTSAGATISGRLVLTPSFIDPAQQTSITTLTTTAHPYDLTLPETSDAGQLGGALLAYALTGKGQPTDIKTVLAAFAGLHMISSDPSTIESATDIVVLGNGALPKNTYGSASELDLVAALSNDQAHIVVAGDSGSAAATGIVGMVRSSTSKSTVSTVDNADSAVGQVSTTLALAGAAKGQVGQYGSQKGSQALFPTPTN